MKKIYIAVIVLIGILMPQITSYAAANDYSVLGQALLVGDSFTAKLEGRGLEKTYDTRIEAYPGITSKELSERILESEEEYQPSKVILLVGINDLIVAKSEEVSIEEEELLLKVLQEKYNAPVYVQLLFPVTDQLTAAKPTATNEKIEEYNKLLAELCYQNGYFVIDTRNEFIGEDGQLLHTEDGLHIESEYQEKWLENIVGAVADQEEEIKKIIEK